MVEAITAGNIDEWLWRKIVGKMYDAEDAAALEKICAELTRSLGEEKQAKKLTREEMMLWDSRRTEPRLLFKEFLKAVLDFQLREHEKFLKRFLEVFRGVDLDGDGVLTEVRERVR